MLSNSYSYKESRLENYLQIVLGISTWHRCQGRSVYVSKRRDPVDMSSWNTGVYLVRVELIDGRQVTRKLLKI